MFFSENTFTRIDDFDRNGSMKPSALLRILENTASHHSDYVADKMPAGHINRIVWIITDWRMEMLRAPVCREKLSVSTWIVGKAPAAHIDRQLLVKNAAGEELVRAEVRHALLNVEENRLVRLDEETVSRYEPEQLRLFEGRMPRLHVPESFAQEEHFALRRSDIDYNGHVHNTSYLDFALEPIDEATLLRGVKSIRMTYRKALKYGDDVTIKSTERDGAWDIGIYSGDELSFAALIECR